MTTDRRWTLDEIRAAYRTAYPGELGPSFEAALLAAKPEAKTCGCSKMLRCEWHQYSSSPKPAPAASPPALPCPVVGCDCRDRAKAVPRDAVNITGIPDGWKLGDGWTTNFGGECDECTGQAVFTRHRGEEYACRMCASALGAIVPAEPSRPVTGEAVDWSKFLPTEEIADDDGRVADALVSGDVFASWDAGSRTPRRSVRIARGVTTDGFEGELLAGSDSWDSDCCRLIRHADGRWAEGYGPDVPIAPPAPGNQQAPLVSSPDAGKPDEASLSQIAANLHDAWWNGRSVSGVKLRELRDQVANLEAKLYASERDKAAAVSEERDRCVALHHLSYETESDEAECEAAMRLGTPAPTEGSK